MSRSYPLKLGLAILIGLLATPKTGSTATNAQPKGEWTMAPAVVDSPWELYATGSGISDAVAEGHVLWAASDGGLLRWDRERGDLIQYLAPAVPLPSNALSEIEPWQDGLVISGYGGVTVFDGGATWTLYRDRDIGLKVEYHAPIAVFEDAVWLAANGDLARLTADGRWLRDIVDTAKPANGRISKLEARADGLYVVYRLGAERNSPTQVSRYAGGAWSRVDQPERVYFEDSRQGLWRLGETSELEHSRDGGKTWAADFPGLSFPEAVTEDVDRNVIVASDDTLLVVSDEAVLEQYRFTAIGPELSYINILEWDASGRLWIASDGRGLSRFDGQSFTNWQPENSDLREDAIRGLAVTPEKLYAGIYASAGDGGVSVFDITHETWTNIWPGETGLSGGGVGGIAVASDGRVYLPTSAGVLDIWDGVNWEHIEMPVPDHALLSTTEALIDPDGHYWVGTQVGYGMGLFEYTGTDWRVYDVGSDISTLARDPAGRLWLGTNAGLVVRDVDHTWHFYTGSQVDMPLGWIGDIVIDREGRVWMVNAQDLAVFNGAETFALSSTDAGMTGWANALALDPDGHIWIGGMFGGMAHYSGEVPIGGMKELTLKAERIVPESELVREGAMTTGPDAPVEPRQISTDRLADLSLTVAAISCGLLILAGIGVGLMIAGKRARGTQQ